MYQLLNLETGEYTNIENPRYVKQDERGIWIRCNEDEAECIAVDGNRFSIAGKKTVEDAPQIVNISRVDAGAQLNKILSDSLQNASDIDEVKAAIDDITNAVLDIYLNGV